MWHTPVWFSSSKIHERSGRWPNMFLDVGSTHTKYIMNDFALAPRTDLLNFKCHTVTNGTDLRKSPLHYLEKKIPNNPVFSFWGRTLPVWFCPRVGETLTSSLSPQAAFAPTPDARFRVKPWIDEAACWAWSFWALPEVCMYEREFKIVEKTGKCILHITSDAFCIPNMKLCVMAN